MSENAEARAAEWLHALRAAVPMAREDLAGRVTRTARWQRQVRHVLASVGATAGGAGSGILFFVRRR